MPAKAPATSENATAARIAGRARLGSDPGGAIDSMITAAPIPVMLAIATTERSMPPMIMVSMTPSAISPNSGNWTAIDCHVERRTKLGVRTAAKKMSSRARITARRVTCGSLASARIRTDAVLNTDMSLFLRP